MAEVANLAVRVGADITPLTRDMKKAGKQVRGFSDRARSLGRRITSLGKTAAAAAAGFAALTAGILALAKRATAAAVEINNLSQVANTGVEEFQKLAFAAETVGISQEKFADILKDVNDKVGDFLVTGGGPMKDFFEQIAPQVGVTAEQFERLSGPQALQLYVNSLEAANLSQERMTFFMEAIASDATALLPLLRANGAEFNRLGTEAERAGLIMDQELIKNATEADRVLGELAKQIETQLNIAILQNEADLRSLATFISQTVIPTVSSLISVFTNIIGVIDDATEAYRRFQGISQNSPTADRNTPPEDFGNDDGVDRGSGTGTLPHSNQTFGNPLELSDDLVPNFNVGEGLTSPILPPRVLDQAQQSYNRSVGMAREHADAIKAIDQEVTQERKGTWTDMFGALEGLAGAGSKKLFRLSQAAAAANALINTHEGITKALAKNDFVTAAAVAVKGAASIAAIRSASVGGGSGGSSGSSLRSAAQASAPSNLVNLQLIGDRFGRDQVQGLFNTLNEGFEDGYRLNLV